LLQIHRDRPKPRFKDADIEEINEQFSKRVRPVREEPQFKYAVVKNEDGATASASSSRRRRQATTTHMYKSATTACLPPRNGSGICWRRRILAALSVTT
jgi:hypothetical protein